MSIVATANLAYRDDFDLEQRRVRQLRDPDFHGPILPLKLNFGRYKREEFGRYEREEFAIYQNVRFRYNGRLPSFASAERKYGQLLEVRKCRFCPRCFWTSEDRSIHESLRTCYLSHIYLGVLLRSRELQHFSNASCIPSIKREGLEILISRYRSEKLYESLDPLAYKNE